MDGNYGSYGCIYVLVKRFAPNNDAIIGRGIYTVGCSIYISAFIFECEDVGQGLFVYGLCSPLV